MPDIGLSVAIELVDDLRANLEAEIVTVTWDTRDGPVKLEVGKNGLCALSADGVAVLDPEDLR